MSILSGLDEIYYNKIGMKYNKIGMKYNKIGMKYNKYFLSIVIGIVTSYDTMKQEAQSSLAIG